LTRNSGLLELLEPEEVILADLGYIGENQIVTLYKNPQHDEDAKMNQVLNRQRVIVENVISRFKQFRSLSTKWRHSLDEHKKTFIVIAEIVNVDLFFRPVRNKSSMVL
jgi:hypothetical protein